MKKRILTAAILFFLPSLLWAEKGGIKIIVDVPDVKVFIDGEIEGLSHPDRPLVRNFPAPGKKIVRVEGKGIPPREKEVFIQPDRVLSVSFNLRPQKPVNRKTVGRLLEEGDLFYRKKQYTTPEGENAFDRFREVLEFEPDNPVARKRIYEMMNSYYEWGEAYQGENLAKVIQFYRRYLSLTRFVLDFWKDRSILPRRVRIAQELTELELRHEAVSKRIREADLCFMGRHFTTRNRKNAFDLYREVLAIDPNNSHAKYRLREMMQWYEQKAEDMVHQDIVKAIDHYDRCRMIADYLVRTAGDSGSSGTLGRIGKKIGRLEELAGDISEAERLYARGFFLSPEKNNAFGLFRTILGRDPENRLARKRILSMMKTFRVRGEKAFLQLDYEGAKKAFRNYLTISEAMPQLMADQPSAMEKENVRRMLLRADQQWILSRLRQHRKKLGDAFQRLDELKKMEKDNWNINEQIIPVLAGTADDLLQIESLYRRLTHDAFDIQGEIEHLKASRRTLEREIIARKNKT